MSGRWQRQEREIARALGTRPQPERGVGEPAIRLPGWAVLVKTRATVPAWLWAALDQAARDIDAGERPAVVISDVVQGRKARRLVLLDPAALLVNTLVMLGSAIGPAPHTLVGDTRQGVNLFAALVGETAKGRKGTSESGPRRLAGEADPDWLARVVAGLSSGEGLIHSVRDPVRKDDPIPGP